MVSVYPAFVTARLPPRRQRSPRSAASCARREIPQKPRRVRAPFRQSVRPRKRWSPAQRRTVIPLRRRKAAPASVLRTLNGFKLGSPKRIKYVPRDNMAIPTINSVMLPIIFSSSVSQRVRAKPVNRPAQREWRQATTWRRYRHESA